MNKAARATMILALTLTAVIPVQAKTLKVWLTGWTGDGLKWLNTDVIPDFQAKYPGVKVAVSTNDWTTRKEKLVVAMAAGSGPDVYTVGSGYAAMEGMEGLALPLDRYLSAWPEKSQFYDRLWDTMKFRGKVYGVPNLTDTRGIAYNKALFMKAGLDPERPPVSWEDILEVAKKTTLIDSNNKMKQAGYTSMWDVYTHQDYIMFLLSAGGRLIDPDMKKVLFNSDAGIEAAQMMTDLYKSSHPTGVSVLPTTDAGLFVQGKAAMIRGIEYALASAKVTAPSMVKDIGLFPIQRGPGTPPTTVAWVNGFSITKHSKDPNMAFNFIRFVCTAKNLVKLNSLIGGCSPRRDSLPIAESTKDIFLPWYRQLPTAVVYPNFPELADLQGGLDAALVKCYLGKSSPKAEIPKAAGEWQKSLDRWWSVGMRKKAWEAK